MSARHRRRPAVSGDAAAAASVRCERLVRRHTRGHEGVSITRTRELLHLIIGELSRVGNGGSGGNGATPVASVISDHSETVVESGAATIRRMKTASLLTTVAVLIAAGFVVAQEPLTWTTQQDHQNMKDQLGIKTLRPGPSGNAAPGAPNAANYDPAKANPFPDLPDPLTLKNGRKVTMPEIWWKQRRPEIVEDFEREVYGRVPARVPAVTWEVKQTINTSVAGVPVVAKQLVGHVDNSSYPAISVDIQMALVLPAHATKARARAKVPVLMMFGNGAMPPSAPPVEPPPGPPGSAQQLIAAGWGYASISPASIQADNGAGLTRGIIGLSNKGQPRKPDDWGALRAWAWGASRGLDYLETDPAVDARRVGIEGVSRYGKAALVAMAFEPRFAMVLVGSSGEGGAKLHRRNFGEAVENLTGSGEYHWMAGNFLKYGTAESTFGSKNAGDRKSVV